MKDLKVLCIVGTRPEAIKMAPVIEALAIPGIHTKVVATAQHRELLDEVFTIFGIRADYDLDVMRPDQQLGPLTGMLLERLEAVVREEQPDLMLAQGDTTTVMVAALLAFYHRVPFGHVEAGLRTGDRHSPFPEEMNRVLVGSLAALHFAPTEAARQHLLSEGVPAARIHVTGNTVIDALHATLARIEPADFGIPPGRRILLMTAHRRESFGAPLAQVFTAVRRLAERNADIHVLYPVHPNPNVRRAAGEHLAGHPRITLRDPMGYGEFVSAMSQAHLILTDSGGIQEEAPALAKPVLVLRAVTERQESLDAGVAKLVGTESAAVERETQRLLDDPAAYKAMARGISPYGDGKAAARILAILQDHLGLETRA